MILTKDKGQRMWGGGFGTGSGGSGGGGGSFDPSMLAGYATEQWTEENYVSKDYFNQIFELQYNHRVLTKNGDIVISDVVTAMVAAPNAIIDTTTHTTTDSETGYTILTSNTVTGIKAKAGLWTEQYLSALGQNAGGGGGGTTLNEPLSSINSAGLAAPGAGQDGMTVVWDNSQQKWKYGSAGGGGSTSWSDITGKPSTIAGYGIVDAKIVSGTITLGSNSITPLTSSDISDMATQTWVGQQGFLTSVAFSDLTSHPTTLSGYGITDAYTKTEADAKYMTIAAFENLFAPLNSSGNAVSHPYSLGVASIKALFGLWTEEYLSALGQDSGGGGGVTLNEPLQSINSAGLGTPSQSGVAIMWNGSAWTYQVPGGGGGGGGTVTSVGMSVPTGFSVSGQPVTGSGTIAITFATGYSLPLTADVTKGVTAYGWGNHANAGYLTSSDIADMATQTWVGQQGFMTSVAFIDLTSHPTTLSGYGITDAYTKTEADSRYITVAFFNRLFQAYNGNTAVTANDTTTTIDNIKAMVGLWTSEYLSALGLNSSGGGGGVSLNEPLATINSAGMGAPISANVFIKWDGTDWIYAPVPNATGTVTSVGMSVPTGFIVSGQPVTGNGTIAITFATGYSLPLTADVTKGVTAYGWGDHAQAGYLTSSDLNGYATQQWVGQQGYLTSSDISDMATQTWVVQQGFLTGSSSIAFSQLPTLYWANVQVSNASNNATSPQFANLTLRNGSATYGSTLYFGDSGAYITEYSEDYLIFNAENGHKFTTMDFEPLEITGSGYVYIKSDGYYGNGLRIGDALLQWDSTNNALKVIKADGTAGNLYATGGISSLGMQSGGGSGATALSDLVDVAISSPTNGQVLMYNNTSGKWYNGTVQQSGGTVTSITAGTGLTGGTITTSGTISLTDQVQTAIAKGVTAYGWGNHANAGYLTSSDIADMATQTWVGQQGFLTGSSAIAFSQLPTLYWANVQVSNVSNNATSPQFANLTLRNGSATYGSTLYFGDHGAYIVEYSEDYLIYNAENGHKFSTMDYEPLEITGSGYVYVKSDGSYGNGLRIGDALLKWDSVNNALKVMKADGTAGNLYATGGVSALGMSAGTSALDAMTFNYLTAANRLYIGDTSSYIYNDTTDIRIKPEGDVVLDGRTWMRGHVYMVGGKYIYLSATSTTGRIYLSSDVYLYTDGSDLKINISGTEYKLYKISV